MTDSANIALVRRMFDAKITPETIREVLAHDVVWDITPGFPYGGVYHGADSVITDFFGRFGPLFSAFMGHAESCYEDGEGHVFVRGAYRVTGKDSGKDAAVRLLHMWTVRDGRVTEMFQSADSADLQRALAG
ncbi:nuclear transport factor 2 family protein [Streptomyces sp. KLOTTS4A1]|uniref:nuclear transport factor 2 family protein n=1 Tax=Streptomyces sp. KLOTTS4A1 TaxID=3390996 RepID=UPI0039F5A81D